jgi:cytochrome P450
MTQAPAIQDFEDGYDPHSVGEFAHGEIEDIYTAARALVEAHGPVVSGDVFTVFGEPGRWPDSGRAQFTVLGESVIREVLSDPERFNMDYLATTFGKIVGPTLTALNDPIHGKVRRVFQAAFMPHNVARWGDQLVGPVANQLIDGFVDRGRAELVTDFALPFPFEIIYRQLNLPPGDTAVFHKMAVAMLAGRGDLHKYAMEASRRLGVYFKDLIAERRKNPGDDLISALVAAEVDGDYIPEDIMIAFLRQLLSAGGDTTYRGTGSMMVGLLQNPDQLERVRADRSLVAQTVEEALRWETPTLMAVRSATCDTELAGVQIPKDSVLTIMTAIANRDPARHRNPDAFDIYRPRERHLAFSYGSHVCLGQHLARLEMSRALNALLDRLPNLRLDPEMPPPRISGINFRTPRDVHVLFD